MYGCDHSLGCLSVSAWRVVGGLKVTASRADMIEKDGIEVSAWRVVGGLKVTAGIICSVNKDAYLRVVPDVVWLTPDMIGGEFDIYSNVIWKID